MEGCPPGSPQWLPELPLTLALSYIWTPPPLASSQDLETSERGRWPRCGQGPKQPPLPTQNRGQSQEVA